MTKTIDEQHALQVVSDVPLFFFCFFTIFLVIFNFTLPNVASIYIVGDLGGSTTITTYAMTFFGLGNALGIPLGIPLSQRLAIGKLFVISLILFAFFTCLCALSPNYPFFIICRLFAGMVSGPLYLFVHQVLSNCTPQKKKKEFSAILVSIFVVVPALGASAGGWIAYDYSWRDAFWLCVPFTLLTAHILWIKLRFISPPLLETNKTFDSIGFFSFALAILSLGFTLTLGQELDWMRSPLIVTTLIIGSVSLVFFILWDLHHPSPLLNLKLLKHDILTFALLNLCVLFSTYFGIIILLSLWLKLDANYTPIWIGIVIGIMALSGLLPRVLIVTRRLGKIDTRIPMGLAIICLTISCFYTTIFDVDIDLRRIILTRIIAGVGFALFLPPIFRLAFHGFSEELSPKIVTLFQVTRSLSSSLGVAVYSTIWLRRDVFYRDRMNEQLTVLSPETKGFFADAKRYYLTGLPAKLELNHLLNRRVTSLALDDCFYLMAWILVGLFIVLMLTYLTNRKKFRP